MSRLTSLILYASVLSCLALSHFCIVAQQGVGSPRQMQQPIGQRVGTLPTDYSNSHSQQAKMSNWANANRQKQLVNDSAKLVELTARLKQHIEARGNQKASEEDFRLLAQVEKLAHNIRERMIYAGEAPKPAPPPQPMLW